MKEKLKSGSLVKSKAKKKSAPRRSPLKRKSAKVLRILPDKAASAFVFNLTIDRQGHLLSYDEGFNQALGPFNDSQLGKNIIALCFPTPVETDEFAREVVGPMRLWRKIFKGLIRHGFYRGEFQCLRENGEQRWFDVSLEFPPQEHVLGPKNKAKGKPFLNIQATCIDQQKAQTNKLRQILNRQSFSLEVGQIGTWEYHYYDKSFWFDANAMKILGLSFPVLSVSDFQQMIVPKSWEKYMDQICGLFAGELHYLEMVLELEGVSEQRVSAFVRALPSVFTEEGRPEILTGTLLDVSQFEQARYRLIEQDRFILKQLEHRKVINGLLKISNMLLPSNEKLRSGLNFLSLLDCWKNPPQMAIYWATDKGFDLAQSSSFGATDGVEQREWPSFTQNPWDKNLKCQIVMPFRPLDAQGNHTSEGMVALLMMRSSDLDDVTDLDIMNSISEGMKQLLAKIKLEQALEEEKGRMVFSSKMTTLGEMFSNMAHEINNPLAVIMGSASVIRRQFNKLNHETDASALEVMKKEIDRILKVSDRMSKIVKGLRTFARNSDLDPLVDTKLASIIEDTLSLCQEKIKFRNIDLRVGAIPDLVIPCRATQICQVLMNLIGNSIDSIDDLNISDDNFGDKWLAINFEVTQENLIIRVSDCGLGIPEAILGKLMAPFYSTKPIGKGTGLGLSISRNILASHQGTMEYNRLAPNTEFVVTLPLSKVDQKAA